eukprot:CAMPEP_0172631328 /NCGR_PEP_ID=MMETSP1068-20121228/178512_1 /TAXON_ID=35684 /ORGANISM="Pseudopedinella elastica, Strain CCMP716" /LENGTH=81 /DNA_ID=CAMNT_0013442429 /DNA_START=82 /DNA_END=324 /DNA_ORIENTATION=+
MSALPMAPSSLSSGLVWPSRWAKGSATGEEKTGPGRRMEARMAPESRPKTATTPDCEATAQRPWFDPQDKRKRNGVAKMEF